MKSKFFSGLLLWLFFLPALFSQTTQQGSRVFQNKKVALVVGNSDYLIGPLRNPVNDARAMKKALEKTGFEVLYHENITNKDNFTKAVRAFGQRLQNGEVGLFYFAGHGLQVKGINFLVPVKAEVLSEPEVEFECLDVGFVLAQMEAANNRMNIVILDACRNNPFARSFRSADRGLATMMAPTGTLIAYATAPGSVAADGEGENGLYTEYILKQITRPGLKIEEVFKNVRAEVVQISNNRQVPWEASSLIGDFYFSLPDNLEVTAVTQQQLSPPSQSEPRTASADKSIIKTSIPKNKTSIPQNRWKADDESLHMEINGKDISDEIVYQYYNDDLLVSHYETNKHFILKNFLNNLDGEWREADEVDLNLNLFSDEYSSLTDHSTGNNYSSYDIGSVYATWLATSVGGFYMYLNGQDITQEVTSEVRNNDVIVYHAKSGYSFILRNYYSYQDNLIRPAEIILDGGMRNQLINVQWRAYGTTYWLAVNGIEQTSNSYSQFEGNDLVIYHRPTGKRFRVNNYTLYIDNRWRPIYPEN